MRLTLDDVRKEYAGTVALGDPAAGVSGGNRRSGDATPTGVDLNVNDGEFFTLVGPSGCGKTTTLRLVAGFDAPTRGAIRFDSREMTAVPPEDRGVGVVFQNYALFPHLSVGENVAYGLQFADPPDGERTEERVASLLELVDLPDAESRDPAELSGGQRQRVALARALAPGPNLLLLDEPMSALDAQLRERLRLQIKRIQSELGITTLYVTHDQEEALAVSDRVAVLSDGAVEQVGTPQAVYRRPETRFVAEFVGDNNVFAGRAQSPRTPNESGQSNDLTGSDHKSPVETEGVRSADSDRRSGKHGSDTGPSRTVPVDVDGVTVPVRTDRQVPSGATVTFCVRPERMTVLGQGGDGARNGADTAVTLDATVSNAEFLGESTRSFLRWEGQELTVRTPDPLAGDVQVGFNGADAHVVNVEAEAGSGAVPESGVKSEQ